MAITYLCSCDRDDNIGLIDHLELYHKDDVRVSVYFYDGEDDLNDGEYSSIRIIIRNTVNSSWLNTNNKLTSCISLKKEPRDKK